MKQLTLEQQVWLMGYCGTLAGGEINATAKARANGLLQHYVEKFGQDSLKSDEELSAEMQEELDAMEDAERIRAAIKENEV
jgi:hypothetical protein